MSPFLNLMYDDLIDGGTLCGQRGRENIIAVRGEKSGEAIGMLFNTRQMGFQLIRQILGTPFDQQEFFSQFIFRFKENFFSVVNKEDIIGAILKVFHNMGGKNNAAAAVTDIFL